MNAKQCLVVEYHFLNVLVGENISVNLIAIDGIEEFFLGFANISNASNLKPSLNIGLIHILFDTQDDGSAYGVGKRGISFPNRFGNSFLCLFTFKGDAFSHLQVIQYI